jgi:hypothetical protein
MVKVASMGTVMFFLLAAVCTMMAPVTADLMAHTAPAMNRALGYLAVKPDVRVVYNTHGFATHGTDALMVHDCINKNGPTYAYRQPTNDGTDVWHLLCFMDDGRWGDLIAIHEVKEGVHWFREKTSLIPRSGELPRILGWLKNHNVSPVELP